MAKAHPGFKSVQASIAKRGGYSKQRAGAILAAATRRASPAAKRANPRLKRVKNPSPPYGSTSATAHKHSALGIQGVGQSS